MKNILFTLMLLSLFSAGFAQNKEHNDSPYCIGNGVFSGKTANYQITGTIGQIAYAQTTKTNNNILAQGFNQPYAYGAPTVQASQIKVSNVTLNSAKISWMRGNGSKCAVFIKNTVSDTAKPNPLTTYKADTAYAKGKQIGTTGWYCIYNDTGKMVNIGNLKPSMQYRVFVAEYKGLPGMEAYLAKADTGVNLASFVTPISPARICMVTNDSTINKNIIVWERNGGQRIDHYNIYRKLTATRDTLLGSVNFNVSATVFADMSSLPSQTAYTYNLTVVDSLGRESQKSPYHKTMNLSISNGRGSTAIILSWNAYINKGDTLIPDKYVIYRGLNKATMTPAVGLDQPGGSPNYNVNINNAKINEYFYVRINYLTACNSNLFKIKEGPYSMAISNLEDNRMKNDSTSVISFQNQLSFTVSPNPFINNATVSYNTIDITDVSFILYTYSGIKMKEYYFEKQVAGDHEFTISSEGLENGLYILQIVTSEGTGTEKLIIQK